MESNTERINQLKSLIEKTKESIKSKELSLKQISKDIEAKESEVKTAQKALDDLSCRKIFTRKELKQFKEKEIADKLKSIEDEKLNIKSETKKKLEQSDLLKAQAEKEESFEKKQELKNEAKKIEIDALTNEIKVLGVILKEKKFSYEDFLAECVYSQWLLKFKKDVQDFSNAKIKSKIKALKASCESLNKEIIDITCKINQSSKRLAECINII